MSNHEERLTFEDVEAFRELCGPEESHFKAIESTFGVRLSTRGASVHIQGSRDVVELLARALRELYGVAAAGKPLTEGEILQSINLVSVQAEGAAREVLLDTIRLGGGNGVLLPKVPGRKSTSMPFAEMMWFLALDRLEPVRPTWRWRWR